MERMKKLIDCYKIFKKCEGNLTKQSLYDEAYWFTFVCNDMARSFIAGGDEQHKTSSGEFLANVKSFTRYEWLRNQSFCWNNQPKLQLTETLTEKGLCFILNGNKEILNKET
jgi:hypothetical protein